MMDIPETAAHRLTLVKSTGEQDGGDPWIHLRTLAYDNRDLRLVEEEYHTSVTGSHRIARRENAWDAMGRRYQRGVYKVNKSNGNFGTPLLSRWFYDAVGRVVREAPAGSDLFTVIVFDAAGQETCRYQAFVPSGSSSSSSSSSSGTPGPDPTDISQSIVVEQAEQAFDKAGNRLSHTRRRRFDNATGLGTLKIPANQPKARVSFMAFYPDALGRGQAEADYGTNGGDPWTRADLIPSSTDDRLVTHFGFSPAGNPATVTNPAGRVTRIVHNKADWLIEVVENDPGSSSSSSSSGFATDTRRTGFKYTDDGWLKELICQNAATGEQVTKWHYGVTPGHGSALYSNRLVREKEYPVMTQRVHFRYNRQQETIGMTDQAGTAHAYDYNSEMANALSRSDALKDGGSTLASFKFLGLGFLTNLKYDTAANAELAFRDGDTFPALDRFDRLIKTLWKVGANKRVHTTYGRNRLGGVTWKRNVLAHALSVPTEDQFTWYDGLQQVVLHRRGTLTGSPPNYNGITSVQRSEAFSFDETGNWLNFSTTGPTLNQNRTHNRRCGESSTTP